jgi:hypothetical protein
MRVSPTTTTTDLVVTANLTGNVRLFLQRTSAAEQGMDPCEPSFASSGSLDRGVATAIGDLTGDGRAELVIATGATGTLIVLLGR